jgi:hypothetical protein
MNTKIKSHSVAHMLDVVLEQQNLKNDAALARAIQVAPPVISKARNEPLRTICAQVKGGHFSVVAPIACAHAARSELTTGGFEVKPLIR